MGIPKLTRDLAPYTERATLTKDHQLDDTLNISSVVIDGPSFVYHVYHQHMKSLPHVIWPMAYRDINDGLVSLLNEMQKHGVDMYGECYHVMSKLMNGHSKKIYFDGALPIAKRSTRLERLERHSRSLDYFVKSPTMRRTVGGPLEQPANGEALLQTTADPPLHNLKALEPPFMISSAIEHLRQSTYALVVEVLPDEAEVGCLLYAAHKPNVAMLSNDSDLVAYPSSSALGTTLVLLNSLERVELEGGGKVLMADCLRPLEISLRLQIPSLHILAFQRLLDPSATFAVVKQRAKRSPVLDKTNLRFHEFTTEYPFDILTRAENSIRPQHRSILDPRLSELTYQYRDSRHAIEAPIALHMYLPALFEDPERESPWAHGKDLRQLAYTIVNLSMPASRASLVEFQRRGSRVAGVEVDLMSPQEVQQDVAQFLQHIRHSLSAEEAITAWQHLALQAVNKKRREDGRLSVLPTFHLNACVQAILYSLTLLKQTMDFVRSHHPSSKVFSTTTYEKLTSLPMLAELMDSMRELYSMK